MQKEVTYREVIAGIMAVRMLRGRTTEQVLSMKGALRIARLTGVLERASLPFQELEKKKYTEHGYSGKGVMPELLVVELTAAQDEKTTITFDQLDDACFAGETVTGETLQILVALQPFMEEQKDEE